MNYLGWGFRFLFIKNKCFSIKFTALQNKLNYDFKLFLSRKREIPNDLNISFIEISLRQDPIIKEFVNKKTLKKTLFYKIEFIKNPTLFFQLNFCYYFFVSLTKLKL